MPGIPISVFGMTPSAQLKRLVDAQSRGQLGFRDKVLAWWEGYDLSGVPKKEAAAKSGETDAGDEPPSKETIKLELSELVWGTGFGAPWEPEFYTKPISLTGLPEDNTDIAFVGADVGGPAIELADALDCSITIYESDEWKSDMAELRIAQRDLADRIRVERRPIDALDLEPQSLGAIICRDRFFEIADTYPVLKHFEEALVPLGHLLISDYVMHLPEDYKDLIDRWVAVEPNDVRLWSIEDYQDNLRDLKFKVYDCKDVSAEYKSKIVKAWSAVTKAVPGLIKREGSEFFIESLSEDGVFWNHRWDALHNPGIRNYVVHALKPNSGKIMSDW